MNVEELKKEIYKKIEHLSINQLKTIDDFIKKINTSSDEEWDLSAQVKNVMKERANVLKKLAQ